MPSTRAEAPRPLRLAAAAAPAIAIALVYAPVFAHGVDVWRSDEELSFGFLVPPAAAAMLAFRRRDLAAASGPGHSLGLAALAAGLGLLVAATRGNVHALAGASFLPVALGAAGYLHGMAAVRLAALPVALTAGALSLYRGLLAPLGFAMQQVTAQASALTAGAVGVPVRRSGVDLFTSNVHLVVAQACSGMDSLLALLCLGALFIGLVRASLGRRLLLIALVLPIVLAANVLRVTLVLVLSGPFGQAVAQGLLHDLLSASLFIAATMLFVSAGLALRCLPQLTAGSSSPA
jgi:exosortase